VSKDVISTSKAPAALGPYSQAVCWRDLLFVSGQIPIDPTTNQVVEGDVAAQTERVLKNLAAILEAAGASLGQVLKTTVYLTDLNDFGKMNEIYARFFSEQAPARATVQVARLPRDVSVEIELIAAAQ
jgi:2-iminobutanoate/2-iminopropanoate deaminase